MVNPFEKRATEYLRDDEAFLAFITPEPLATFFEKPAKEDRLYDRLAVIIGTPGSGKTTLARLFQFPTLQTLLRNQDLVTYKPLIDALTMCGAISNGHPTLVGGRLPLESEYREFWEFPYPEELKIKLMIALLQARTILTWLRNFSSAGINLSHVEIIPRTDADAALTAIGGTNGVSLLERARQVELAIYRISAALMPPELSEIDSEVAAAYRPFDVIESFRVKTGEDVRILRPLVIFDDAHSLHPTQLAALQRWLARRELKVARWILMRLDALNPKDVLMNQSEIEDTQEPGLKRTREITHIWLQSIEDRSNQRRAFRKMARDMADRYLRQMEIFNRRGLHSLGDILSTEVEMIPPNKREELAKQINTIQQRCKVSSERRKDLEIEVDQYLQKINEPAEDLRLAMLAILFERYAKRIPQRGLFDENETDLEPNRPLTVDVDIADGARIHLLHKYGRPYFFGLDTLCDAGSENAEQFLQLAARLVSQSETQLIRTKPPTLRSSVQNSLLRERAEDIVREWDFPQHQQVRKLVNVIAQECIQKSLEPNAPLGKGASAFGIPQEEFDAITTTYPDLAKILQFGVAYNAFVLVPNYGTKKKLWCLIELGGVLLLKHGLTFGRGGFIERKTSDLLRILSEP